MSVSEFIIGAAAATAVTGSSVVQASPGEIHPFGQRMDANDALSYYFNNVGDQGTRLMRLLEQDGTRIAYDSRSDTYYLMAISLADDRRPLYLRPESNENYNPTDPAIFNYYASARLNASDRTQVYGRTVRNYPGDEYCMDFARPLIADDGRPRARGNSVQESNRMDARDARAMLIGNTISRYYGSVFSCYDDLTGPSNRNRFRHIFGANAPEGRYDRRTWTPIQVFPSVTFDAYDRGTNIVPTRRTDGRVGGYRGHPNGRYPG